MLGWGFAGRPTEKNGSKSYAEGRQDRVSLDSARESDQRRTVWIDRVRTASSKLRVTLSSQHPAATIVPFAPSARTESSSIRPRAPPRPAKPLLSFW
jgi:hypothetical protein